MLTSSCETFLKNGLTVQIFRMPDGTVEVKFFSDSYTSNGTVSYDGSITGNATLNLNDYNRLVYTNSNRSSSSYGFYDHTSHQRICGYTFYFEDGFLKCWKNQITDHSILSAYNLTREEDLVTRAPCHPNDFVYHLNGDIQVAEKIQYAILMAGSSIGIFPPSDFVRVSHVTHNQYILNSNIISCPVIDWLSYPIIREIGDELFSRELNMNERNLIAPLVGQQMTFKDLVEFYYGTSTKKMLEEIWNVIKVDQIFSNVNYNYGFINDSPSLPTADTGSFGRRSIFQSLVFSLGPAIFKTMGFDYLYQFLPMLNGRVFHEKTTQTTMGEFLSNLDFLRKFLTEKKILTLLVEQEDGETIHFLSDSMRMLRDYSSVDKIPEGLRQTYPEGLTVDFKFKTLKEMHDKIAVRYTAIKAEASRKKIPIHPLYEKLNGRERDGLRLVLPTDTSFLAKWGTDLSICIASYGDRAAEGTTLLMGVEKNGEIKYCIEFRSFKLADKTCLPYVEERMTQTPLDVADEEGLYHMPDVAQFRALRNGVPLAEDRSSVDQMLAEWATEHWEEIKKIKEETTAKGMSDRFIAANDQFINNVFMGHLDDRRLIADPYAYAINNINAVLNIGEPQ